jgi:glycosyltransferase involved in cell wall biosynthesis
MNKKSFDVKANPCTNKYVFNNKQVSVYQKDCKKVSVIIPNYNYAKYLSERIESVLNQTYPVYEIIILDDKSNDNSMDIIRQYQKDYSFLIKVVENDINSNNVFKQWEKGLLHVTGDFIWIAEADDSANQTLLESLMGKIAEDEEIVLAYAQSKVIDENNQVIKENYLDYTDDVDNKIWRSSYISSAWDEVTRRLSVKNTIPNISAVVFKKTDFSDIIKVAKEFTIAGDWCFYVDFLLSEKGKVAYISESLNYHRRHSRSVAAAIDNELHYEEFCRMQDYVMEKTGSLSAKKYIFSRKQIILVNMLLPKGSLRRKIFTKLYHSLIFHHIKFRRETRKK